MLCTLYVYIVNPKGNPKMLKEEQSMNLVGLFRHFNYVESTYIDVEHTCCSFMATVLFVSEQLREKIGSSAVLP